jgi:hypothetical protein
MKLTISWIGFKIAIRIYFFSVASIPFIIWAENLDMLEDYIFIISVTLTSFLQFFAENEETRISIQRNGNIVYDNTILYTIQKITLGLFLFAISNEIYERVGIRFFIEPFIEPLLALFKSSATGVCLPLNGCVSDLIFSAESERFYGYVFSSCRQAFLHISPYVISCIRISSAFNITIAFGDAIRMALYH